MGEPVRGAEARLTRAEIVATARRLLAERGVEGLTMRAVGEACGVQGPALYWHIKDKDELLGLIVDSVSRDLASGTDDQPWDERLLILGRSLRALMVEHRGLAIVAAGRYTVSDTTLDGIEDLMRVLVGAGFTARQALAIHYAVMSFATGFVIYETSSPLFELAAATPGTAERARRAERFAPLVDGGRPHVSAAAAELGDLTVDELFEQSLVALVQGWALQLRPGTVRRTRAAGRTTAGAR